jgi:hypothetical protein
MILGRKRKEFGVVVVLALLVFALMPTTMLVTADDPPVNQPPIADANGPYDGRECVGVWLDATGSHDPDGDSLQYRWLIDGEWTEWSTTSFIQHVWRDDYTGTVELEVTDGIYTSTDYSDVSITNWPPYIYLTTGPTEPLSVGTEAQITVNFYDGDDRSEIYSLDTYTATFYWDGVETSTYYLGVGEFTVTGTHTYYREGEYEVLIVIEDDDGGVAMDSYFVYMFDNQILTIDAGPDGATDEGSSFVSMGSFNGLEFHSYDATVDFGDGTGIQTLLYNTDYTFDLNHHYCENGLYTVTVSVTDETERNAIDTAEVTVANVAPTITSLSGPPTDPIQINTPVILAGIFTDPGCQDTHTAEILWGDSEQTDINVPFGTYQVTQSHTYAEAGVYTITLIVTDDDGGSDSKTIDTYVVVYDPNSGFVTGGGWITAPSGSYPADPTLSGRANFGFVSKYKKGHSIPEGNTEFQFQIASLNFHSQVYEWLVVAGPKAMYKGTGTINGAGNYGFLLSAIDGQINGGGGVDKFRIKIWDKNDNDVVVFDNNLGLPEDGNPSTALGGGQITIHKN